MVQLGIWFSRSWLQHPSGTTRVLSTCLVTTLSAQGCSRIWKTHFRHFASQVASCTWWQCKSVQKPGKVRPEMLDTWIVGVCWCNVLLRHYTYIYICDIHNPAHSVRSSSAWNVLDTVKFSENCLPGMRRHA